MAQTFNVIYSCTPTQLETVLATIAAVPAVVIRAPIQSQGLIKLSTGEQIDFSYDGAYFLRFFGANPSPTSGQPQAGIPQTEISPIMTAFLFANVQPTCGAPVPSNQAVPPSYVP